MRQIRLRTAHGTYLRAGDLGEVNQAGVAGPWEVFTVEAVPESLAQVPPARDPRQWHGNFLAWNGGMNTRALFPTFYYAGLDARDREIMRHAYRGEGYTHFVIGSVWNDYDAIRPEVYDWSDQPEVFAGFCRELKEEGFVVHAFAHDRAERGPGAWPASRVVNWWRQALPIINPYVDSWATDWETDQSGPAWADGHEAAQLAIELRRIVGPDRLLYFHFSRNRWSAWPGPTGDHNGQEADWWRGVRTGFTAQRLVPPTGLLYQADSDEAPTQTLFRFLRDPAPHGWPPGIVGRIMAQGYDCVFFESAHDKRVWDRLIAEVKQDGRARGWC